MLLAVALVDVLIGRLSFAAGGMTMVRVFLCYRNAGASFGLDAWVALRRQGELKVA